jgi:hypothetical protein
MWHWDDKVGTPLAEYVVYNVGARLRNVVAKEVTKKRCPQKRTVSLQKKLYEDSNGVETLQDSIQSKEPSQEERLAFKEALECIDNELPYLAKTLFQYMVEEDGNFTEAAKRLQKKVRGLEEVSPSAFRMQLRRNVIPEIHSVLVEKNLINQSARKKIIQNFVQQLIFSI